MISTEIKLLVWVCVCGVYVGVFGYCKLHQLHNMSILINIETPQRNMTDLKTIDSR